MNLILLVFSFVLLVLASFKVGDNKWNLTAGGLAFYIASLLFGRL